MISANINFSKDLIDWISTSAKRTSAGHRRYMMRHIAGRVIHAATVYNFVTEASARPKKWPRLSPLYAKIKEASINRLKKHSNKQPQFLGKYPLPRGRINVRTGWLFNTLGTIFKISGNILIYGTNAPHAKKVQEGHTVKRLDIEAVRRHKGDKTGEKGLIHTKYRRTLKKPVTIPPRPYNYLSRREMNAILETMTEYIFAGKKRKTVLIPKIIPPIKAPGGRRVYILGSRT